MSRATSLLRMTTEEELVPKDKQVGISTSNVKIDAEEVFTNSLHQIAIAILKTHIIYNSLTLTATVPSIYIQQFWHTVFENEATKMFLFRLDSQWFEVGVDLIRRVLKLTPPQQNQQYTTPPTKESLLQFVKKLGYYDPDNEFKTISQAIVAKHHQPWRTILSILNKCLTGKDSGLDRVRHTIIQLLWGLFNNSNLDYAALIWDEFKLQITSRMKRQTKAEKLPFPRFTKLIIAHIMSNNKTINERSDADMHTGDMDEMYKPAKVAKGGVIHYGLLIPDTLLNDTIREMDAYKEYVENSQEVAVPVVQPQPVDPTHGTHKNTRAGEVRKTRGKGLIREGGVPEPAKPMSTKKRKTTSKEKPAKEKPMKEKSKKAKETYVDDPDQIHNAIILSSESERLRQERIEREQRMIDEDFDDDLDDTLEAMKTQKLNGVAEYDDEPQIAHDAQLLLDFKRTSKLSRRERSIQELLGGPGEGSETRIETQEIRDSLDSDKSPSATRLDIDDDGDEGDVSNHTVLVHGKTKVAKEKETPILTTISSPRTRSSQNKTPAPSLEDVSLPRIAGTSRLNSHDGSSGKEKPSGDSVDSDRLSESQTVVVPEFTMTEPTGLDQSGSTGVDSVLADPILSPPITTIITTKPTASKQKKHVRRIVTNARRFNPLSKQFMALQKKVDEQQRKMDEFIAHTLPAVVQESVSAKVIEEVKNHTPTLVLDGIVRPCLHKVVSHVLRTEQITLTTSPTNITIPQLKAKLYEMMTNDPDSIQGDINTHLYIALSKSVEQDEQKMQTD